MSECVLAHCHIPQSLAPVAHIEDTQDLINWEPLSCILHSVFFLAFRRWSIMQLKKKKNLFAFYLSLIISRQESFPTLTTSNTHGFCFFFYVGKKV